MVETTNSIKPLRVPRKEITQRYLAYYGHRFGTLQQLLDEYGHGIYDEVMREKYGEAYKMGKYEELSMDIPSASNTYSRNGEAPKIKA